MNKRFLFLSTVLVLLLAACNQPNPTPSTGTLQVNILGLPAGVNASANVTGTDFAQALTATTTLNDRTPGSYTVAASNVSSGTATFAPTVSGSPATVTAGSTATVNVSYAQNLKPGSLTITFTGLPVDTSGSAVVTGPGGNQTVSGLNTVTLNNLVPGQYSISSAPIRVKRTVVDPIFDPTVASANATVTVNPEATTTHAVTYFQRAGTGALWVPTSQGFIKGYANAQLALDGAVDPLGSLTQTGINEQAIFDQAGRLYVSNSTDNAIYSAIGGLPAIQGNKTGLNRPRGMAFDKNGNLWVVNAGIVTGADSQKDDSIVSFSPAQLQAGGNQTPQITLTSTSFFDPIGIAFDASNNLWVSNFGNATILKLSPADLSVTGSVTLAAAITGLNTPTGLAFDSTGNLWWRISSLQRCSSSPQRNWLPEVALRPASPLKDFQNSLQGSCLTTVATFGCFSKHLSSRSMPQTCSLLEPESQHRQEQSPDLAESVLGCQPLVRRPATCRSKTSRTRCALHPRAQFSSSSQEVRLAIDVRLQATYGRFDLVKTRTLEEVKMQNFKRWFSLSLLVALLMTLLVACPGQTTTPPDSSTTAKFDTATFDGTATFGP